MASATKKRMIRSIKEMFLRGIRSATAKMREGQKAPKAMPTPTNKKRPTNNGGWTFQKVAAHFMPREYT